MSDIRVAIDRGGTFCDVIAHIAGRPSLIFKLLSVDPANYTDAPTEAIRRVLEVATTRSVPKNEKLDGSQIVSCRIGTTVCTNALLERKGDRFAFLTTKGFGDVCVIGDQTRPKLFDLHVQKPEALHDTVVEVDERVTMADYDLNPRPLTTEERQQLVATDSQVIETSSGDLVRILQAPDLEVVRRQLHTLKDQGYRNLAIAFLHGHVFPDHEEAVAELARSPEFGDHFRHITLSSQASGRAAGKLLARSNATCSEAYLAPVIQDYVSQFAAGFAVPPQRVEFMCSDGGLRAASRFGGNEALLSGPAGGVVGLAASCFDQDAKVPLIGFDMGGTSTDVCRYDGAYDYLTETTIAGRTINVPMLNILTVAAGGGSILFARNGLLVVGPESAGADPGPACYRKGGPLTVTDANLFLGRLVLSSFPAIFGPNADQPLDTEVVATKFDEITADFNQQTGQSLSPQDVALGFLQVANETMSRPIRNATEARGFAPEAHDLVSFGGAGGQHACTLARSLGVRRILVHRWSSLLSAHGIAQAALQHEARTALVGRLTGEGAESALVNIKEKVTTLREEVVAALAEQGAAPSSVTFEDAVVLRYFGTDTSITVPTPNDGDYAAAFRAHHLREFSFNLDRAIVIDAVMVRGTGRAGDIVEPEEPFAKELADTKAKRVQPDINNLSSTTQKVYFNGQWEDVPVLHLDAIPKGTTVLGPALVIDKTQTIIVNPGFVCYVLTNHVVLEVVDKKSEDVSENASPDVAASSSDNNLTAAPAVDNIQLSVYAHRFMAIAEQMGNTLQRTAISSSIKERLDFSCAIFAPDGKLVANAPHIPIHLGSMQFAIQYQHKLWAGKLQPGDALLTNHPQCGGTHLPDLTVVSPVFVGETLAFYVASRGHHTDIGGRGITSMMPESKQLWEEGVNVRSLQIVRGGVFLEDDVRAAFAKAGEFPGCSATRRIADNLSDLRAQLASNQRGITLLHKLCTEPGSSVATVHHFMYGIQANAQTAVRAFFSQVAHDNPEPLTAIDHFDDGTAIQLKITIDGDTGGAVFDFAGTGPQSWGNYNCPVSITHSAIIYTVRCLVNVDIPLNEGCLAPVTINIPEGSILNPGPAVAVCGSTLASQRVVDTILRAFGRCAASQGCANSFGWGMGGRDPLDPSKVLPGWNYGESLGGGVGAGPGWHGASATNVHSTNTRNTDPEVVERRTAVLVRKYAIRKGSGGRGKWHGGDGVVREIEARVPLSFSILSDRRVYAPYGMAGGQPGKVGVNYAFKRNGEDNDRSAPFQKINLGGKAVIKLEAGERIQINTPGGGGWGKEDGTVERTENIGPV